MACLSVSQSKIAVVSPKGCFVSGHRTAESHLILKSSNETPEIVDNDNGKIPIFCSTFSPSGSQLAVCENKHLVVWCPESGNIISKRPISRAASKIRYTPDGKSILVADKSGDVYSFDSSSEEPGQFLLGHLSILLDLLVTPDSKYIITCDRDEKIRVSCYPNAYNIQAYCLGHKQYVSALDLLPHDVNVLISSSGDGSLRLWDFKVGKQLLCHQVSVSGSQDEDHTPIISLSTAKINEENSYVCVLPTFKKCILVYSVSANSFTIVHTLSFDEEPLAMALWGQSMHVISHSTSCINSYNLNVGEKHDLQSHHYKGHELLKCHLEGLIVPGKLTEYFLKKDFSEVAEYYKRKTERFSEIEAKRTKIVS